MLGVSQSYLLSLRLFFFSLCCFLALIRPSFCARCLGSGLVKWLRCCKNELRELTYNLCTRSFCSRDVSPGMTSWPDCCNKCKSLSKQSSTLLDCFRSSSAWITKDWDLSAKYRDSRSRWCINRGTNGNNDSKGTFKVALELTLQKFSDCAWCVKWSHWLVHILPTGTTGPTERDLADVAGDGFRIEGL